MNSLTFHWTSGLRPQSSCCDSGVQQNHWSERGRAASVANPDALGASVAQLLGHRYVMSKPEVFIIESLQFDDEHAERFEA